MSQRVFFGGNEYFLPDGYSPLGGLTSPEDLIAAVANSTGATTVINATSGSNINTQLAAAATVLRSNTYGGGTIQLPPGNFILTTEFILSQRNGCILRGAGKGATILHWNGPATSSVIKLLNCVNCQVLDLTIVSDTTTTCYSGIEIRKTSTLSGQSRNNVIQNVQIGLSPTQSMTYGFYVSGDIDANNDFHKFICCDVANTKEASLEIDRTQSVGNQVLFPDFLFSKRGCAVGLTPLRAGDAPTGPLGGAFDVLGGAIGGNSVSDLHFGGVGPGVFNCSRFGSEGSSRLYTTSGPAFGVPQVINLSGIRWSSDSLNADGFMILDNWGSTLTMEACRFDASAAEISKVYLNCTQPRYVRIEGNLWNQVNSALAATVQKNGTPSNYIGPARFNIGQDASGNILGFSV